MAVQSLLGAGGEGCSPLSSNWFLKGPASPDAGEAVLHKSFWLVPFLSFSATLAQ